MLRDLKRKRRRAVSSIIGGVFVLIIMVIGISAIILVTTSEAGVHSAANSAALIDNQRNEERLNIQTLAFGGSQDYSPTQGYVTGSTCVKSGAQKCGIIMSSGTRFGYDNTQYYSIATRSGAANYTDGSFPPKPAYGDMNVTSTPATGPGSIQGQQEMITDMNFTSNTAGWTVYSTSPYATGGWDPIHGQGNPGSGVGSMFVGYQCTASNVVVNESTRFFVNPSSTGTGQILTAQLSIAMDDAVTGNSPGGTVVTRVFLINENTSGDPYWSGYKSWTVNVPAVDNFSTGSNVWLYATGVTSVQSDYRINVTAGIGTAASIYQVFVNKGYYDLNVQSVVSGGNCNGNHPTASQLNYDDVGILVSYSSLVVDFNYRWVVNQTPTSVQGVQFSVTTSYNQTNVLQDVYVYDWSLNKYDLFSSTTVATGTTTVSISTNVTNSGQFSAQNLVNNNGTVILRIYAVCPNTQIGSTHYMELDVTSVGQGSLSATVTYQSSTSFSYTLYNASPVPVSLISLILIDAHGHSYINGTGAIFGNGTKSSEEFSLTLYPFQSVTAQANYTWLSGSISIEFLSSRGNLFLVTAIAP